MYEIIKEWMIGLGPWGAVVVVMVTVLPVLLWLLKPLILHNPVTREYSGTYPKKRHPNIKDIRLFAGGGFANWKTGIYGPKDRTFEVPPYCSSHVTSVSSDKCTVRSGHKFFSRRIVFGFIGCGFLLAFGVFHTIKDYNNFNRGGGSCLKYIAQSDGDKLFTKIELNKDIFGFIKYKACYFTFTLENTKRSTKEKLGIIFGTFFFPLWVLLLGLLGALYFYVKPAPPPIIFDRKRRLVYTQHKGKTYIGDWDTLSISPTTGHLASGLGLELFTKDEQGNWQPKWFSLAGYHYHFEFWIGYLWDSGLSWMKRWEGMRGWLILYMDKGPEYVHAPVDRKGFLDYFVPFRKKLPEDIENKTLSLIGDDKAPGDEDLRIKEKDYPPHIKDLYKFWSDWKKYLNQTLPRKRREITKEDNDGK